MIGLHRQLHNGPPTLGTFLLDEQPTVLSNGATKDSFAPLGAPEEMGDDQVDAVCISLAFHVDIVEYNNEIINTKVLPAYNLHALSVCMACAQEDKSAQAEERSLLGLETP